VIANSKEKGMVVGSSDIKMIRVGFSNIIFIIFFVGLILLNQVLNDLNINILVKGIILLVFCLATLKVYTHSVSRIYINDGKTIVIVGPFSIVEIDLLEISKTKIYGIPSSMTIFLEIKRKMNFFPSFYYFVSTSTNYGPYNDTMIKLASMISEAKSEKNGGDGGDGVTLNSGKWGT
jgi:hypothetical protein